MADAPEAEDEGQAWPRSPFPERRLPGGQAEDIPMDGELLKVLASDSRRDILRYLRKRRMTLTELAAALDLKKATVLEHLKKLTDAGLVKRIEDERLWVYYELTHRGGRVVNPGRTRFYLLMGVAAAALVLGGSVVALLALDPDAPGSPMLDARDTAASTSPGAGSLSVDVALGDASPQKTRAYLLTAQDAEHLRGSGGAVAGIPLALEEARGDVARFRSLSGVPPGDYYLYVVDEDGRDNLDSLSAVRVPSLMLEAPERAWQGIDGNVTFSLTRDGKPAEGTLLLAAGDGNELPTLALSNGTATLDASTLDRLVPTRYVVQYLPEASQFWISLDHVLTVERPLDALWPLQAVEGRATTFRIALARGAVAPQGQAPVWAGDAQVATVKAASEVAFDHAPPRSGVALYSLGRLPAHAVEVVPDYEVDLDLAEAATLRLTREGEPVPDVAVGFGNRTLDLTDADGRVAFAPPEPGAYELRLVRSDGVTVHRAIRFDGGNFTEEPDRILVADVTAERVPGGLRAAGRVVNEGAATERVTLVLLVDGRAVATRAMELPPRASLPASMAADVPLAPGEHAVAMQALTLRHAELDGARDLDDAYAVAPAAGAARFDAGNESVTLIHVTEATKPVAEALDLQPRTTSGAAADEGRAASAAPAAKTPGPSLLLAAAAVALALLAARRRR